MTTLGPQVVWNDVISEQKIDQMRVYALNRKLQEEELRLAQMKRKRFTLNLKLLRDSLSATNTLTTIAGDSLR